MVTVAKVIEDGEEVNRTLYCQVHEQSFSTMRGYSSHMTRMHNTIKTSIPENGEVQTEWVCKHVNCNPRKKFSTEKYLKRHNAYITSKARKNGEHQITVEVQPEAEQQPILVFGTTNTVVMPTVTWGDTEYSLVTKGEYKALQRKAKAWDGLVGIWKDMDLESYLGYIWKE